MLDRRIIPHPENFSEIIYPEINKFTLKSGPEVYHIQKSKLPLITLIFFIPGGSKFDPAGKEGIGFLNSMLIDEGAGGLSGLELSDRLTSTGSALAINTTADELEFSLLALKENFESTLEIASKVFFEPSYSLNDFNREKSKLLNGIIQNNKYPAVVAEKFFRQHISGVNNAYCHSLFGSLESTGNITHDEILNYYTNFVKGRKPVFVVTGDIDTNELSLLLEKYFPAERLTQDKLSNPEIKFEKTKSKLILVDFPGAPQAEIIMGFPRGPRNERTYYTEKLLNTIFGGSFNSRLNMNLREREGYTYGISSNFSYKQQMSNFVISTGVDNNNAGNAIYQILQELKLMKEEEVTPEELKDAKDMVIRKFPLSFETYSATASALYLLAALDLPLDYYKKFVERIDEVKAGDIQFLANDVFDLDSILIVVAGNRNEISDSLEGNFTGEVIEVSI
ncbi:MAG: insulinase family protein [Ignavibacteriaceae bacterium]|nr:insulinase family protein [Ignavibacteriaceae bacterium]